MDLPLGILSAEVRQLVREQRVVAHGWAGRKAEIEDSEDEFSLGDEGGPRRLSHAPSSSELMDSWQARYESLAATDHLLAMVPELREKLLSATAAMPCVFPRGPLPKEDEARLRKLIAPVKKAVSIFATFVHAVEGLRSTIAFATGETDTSGFDAYKLGGDTMHDPRYRSYNSLLGKLGRSNPKTIARRKKIDARPENRAKRAKHTTEARKDPAFRAHENETRRKLYAKKKAAAAVIASILTSIENDNPISESDK